MRPLLAVREHVACEREVVSEGVRAVLAPEGPLLGLRHLAGALVLVEVGQRLKYGAAHPAALDLVWVRVVQVGEQFRLRVEQATARAAAVPLDV